MNKANAFATGAKLLSAVPAFLAGLSMFSSQATGQDMSQRSGQLLQERQGDRREGHLQEPVPDDRRGEPVPPQGLEPGREASRHRRRAPDGRGEGAERQPLRHEDGRAGVRRPVPGLVLLGRERGRAAQRRLARTSTRRPSAPRWTSWAPGRSSTGSGSGPSGSAAAGASSSARPRSTRASEGHRDRQHVRHGGRQPARAQEVLTLEQRKKVIAEAAEQRTWSSRAARPSTRAGPCTS